MIDLQGSGAELQGGAYQLAQDTEVERLGNEVEGSELQARRTRRIPRFRWP